MAKTTKKMKGIILSAGKGERLTPITDSIPKVMIPLDGKPLLEYSIKLCKSHGVKEIAINTHHLSNKIKNYFENGERLGVKIRYSYEDVLLGTSGSLNNFRDFFNETFFVIYGDVLTDLNLRKMLEYHKSKAGLATILLDKETMPDEKTTPGIVLVDKDFRVKRIIENPTSLELESISKVPEYKFNNFGIYILEPEVLSAVPKGYSDFAKDIFPKLIKQGGIFGFKNPSFVRELGAMHRYKLTEEEIKSGKLNLKI